MMLPVRSALSGVLSVSLLLSTTLLPGCAPGGLTTQSQRIGPDDGTDSCHRYLVALDAEGDYFAADILKGAAVGALVGGLAGGLLSGNYKGALIGAGAGGLVGGAAGYWAALQQQSQDRAVQTQQVQADLQRENSQIARAQIAFDSLQDCRFQQARSIQMAYDAHQIDRATAQAQMAVVRQRAATDLQVAQRINAQIAGRADQFNVAVSNVEPGTPPPAQPATRPAVVRRAAPLKLTPSADAPQIGALQASQSVQVGGSRNGFAFVQTPSGSRGFAPVDAFRSSQPAPSASSDSGGDVRTLAGSNAARRDDFAQSVAVSEQAASHGFDLAG